MAAVDYLSRAVLLTIEQLLVVLGPGLVLAYLLHYLSSSIRGRVAGILGVDGYTYLTAPGVMVHELGHAVFCLIFRHRIVRMRLFSPQRDGTLGSVEHAYNPRSTYQQIGNFFIGTGPIWFGSALIYLLVRVLLGAGVPEPAGTGSSDGLVFGIIHGAWRMLGQLARPSIVSGWRFWLFAYLVFCIASHITLSPPDVQGASRGLLSLVAALLIFNIVTLGLAAGAHGGAYRWLLRGTAAVYAANVAVVGVNLLILLIAAGASAARRLVR